MLKEQYQAEIAAGRISPERQQLFDAIMAEAGDLVNTEAEELDEMMARSSKAKDLLNRMSDAVARPDALTALEELPAGSRAARLAELNERLFKYIISESSKAHSGEQEWAMLQALMPRYISSRNAIAELGEAGAEAEASALDEATYKLEYENTRRLALDTRRYALREHLTLATPAWPAPAFSQMPNSIFYSGGPESLALLEAICDRQELTLLPLEVKGDPAAERWKQLREANIAIFDLSDYRRPAPLDEAPADAVVAVAAVGYELGIALALGRPVVAIAKEGQAMPFDLDVEPLRLAGNDEDGGRLAAAMDEALYGLQRGGADSSVDETLRYVRQEYADHEMAYVRIALEQIDDSAGADPLKVRDILSAALGYLGPEAPQIIYPTWPGDYPALYQRRCFHVTAFGPDWANETMALVRESCQSAGEAIEYIRGDQVLSPDIIRSIWDEICRASHVVVDLTGLNINAVLELGMAHALGRNILIITQDDRPDLYFRSIAKVRLHHYDLGDPAALQGLLASFFA
jgi:nucleoside 2-deoxyribosyltransferase